VNDLLRKLSLLAVVAALALSLAGVANAKPGKGMGDSSPNGNAWGLTGFSDGR
jgi:hypothetical protein